MKTSIARAALLPHPPAVTLGPDPRALYFCAGYGVGFCLSASGKITAESRRFWVGQLVLPADTPIKQIAMRWLQCGPTLSQYHTAHFYES